MKILLTGATGFLGSHLLKKFVSEKYNVVILKRSTSNVYRIENELKEVKSYDVDRVELSQVFEENEKFDAIVHTATCYGRQHESILQMEKTNLIFPLKLLENAVQFECSQFFNTDTTLKRTLNYYALSKKQFVDWGMQLAKEKKIRFYNLRLEHMYGEMDDKNKFIPFIIHQCRLNKPIINLTEGNQRRDFIYIENVIEMYDFLLKQSVLKTIYFDEFDIGTSNPISIKKVVENIHQLTRSKSKLNFGAVPYRKNETMYSSADSKKLLDLGFDFSKIVSFEQGIRKII